MKTREKLYTEALLEIEAPNPRKQSILYHNIYSLKMSGSYLFSTKEDIRGLVEFLNSCEQ